MTKVCVSSWTADLVGVRKHLNHVYDGAPLGGVGFEQRQSFSASGRRKELQDEKEISVAMRGLRRPGWGTLHTCHCRSRR